MPVGYDDFVKKSNQEHEYTEEQIKELYKCKKNIYHFCKYVKIVHPDHGRVIFEPYDFQKDIIDTYLKNRFLALLLARQVGKSTVVGVIACWYAIFNKDKRIGITSYIEKEAIKILDKIKIIYEELPLWLKPGVKDEYNKKSIVFENGTNLMVSATTKNAFRGEALNLLISDELAFVPAGQANDFWTSNVPTTAKSQFSKIIIISTPAGQHNLFHRIWQGALKGSSLNKRKPGKNGFVPIKYDWTCVPERTKEWAEGEKERLGKTLFRQEHSVEFLGSINTLIDADILKILLNKTKTPKLYDLGDKFRIYEKLQKGCSYVLGVDTGKGSGEHYSTIQVLRIDSSTPVKAEQVAVYENNTVDPYNFSEIVNKIAIYYNNAYIMVENNSEGNTVVSELHWRFENEGLVNTGNKIANLGIRATRKTKPRAVILMKKLIEGKMLKLNDEETVQQLTDFVDKGNNRFACNNLNDDLVSGLYWAVYIFLSDLMDQEITFQKDKDPESEGWGLLSDVPDHVNEDWSWL